MDVDPRLALERLLASPSAAYGRIERSKQSEAEQALQFAWEALKRCLKAGEVRIESLDRARDQGGKVAFDSNYRPRGWPSESAAREAFELLLKRTDIALPTFGDEQALHGDSNPRATIARLNGFGVPEVAVKDGERPLHVSDGDCVAVVEPEKVHDVVDTTAAGDASPGEPTAPPAACVLVRATMTSDDGR